MTVTYTAPTKEAIKYIATNLSQADRDELAAARDVEPEASMLEAVALSKECFVALIDGVPAVLLGVADYPGDASIGIPWMLATDAIQTIPRRFYADSRKWVDAWSEDYAVLFNLVDHRHVRACRWLLHLGFKPIKVHDTLSGVEFIEFTRLSNV